MDIKVWHLILPIVAGLSLREAVLFITNQIPPSVEVLVGGICFFIWLIIGVAVGSIIIVYILENIIKPFLHFIWKILNTSIIKEEEELKMDDNLFGGRDLSISNNMYSYPRIEYINNRY